MRGIGDGTLDLERFRFWLRQDYLFLIEYARMLAFGTARAPDLETMAGFAELAYSTLASEMQLHRDYAAQFGITADELDREAMAPTTRAYTDFLVRTAAVGDFAALVAPLLPCMWGFNEIGLRLASRPRPSDDRYAAWIETYADDEFTRLAGWCRQLCDRIAADAGRQVRGEMHRAFTASSHHELAFWEMGWHGES